MRIRNKELRGLSETEIKAKLSDLRLQLIKLRTQVATGIIQKNPSQIRDTRKMIARMLQQLHVKLKTKNKVG